MGRNTHSAIGLIFSIGISSPLAQKAQDSEWFNLNKQYKDLVQAGKFDDAL